MKWMRVLNQHKPRLTIAPSARKTPFKRTWCLTMYPNIGDTGYLSNSRHGEVRGVIDYDPSKRLYEAQVMDSAGVLWKYSTESLHDAIQTSNTQLDKLDT